MNIEPACCDLTGDKLQNKGMPLNKRDNLLKTEPFFLCKLSFKVESHEPEKLRSIGYCRYLHKQKAVLRRLISRCDNGIKSAVDDTAQVFGKSVCVVVKYKEDTPVTADTLESL